MQMTNCGEWHYRWRLRYEADMAALRNLVDALCVNFDQLLQFLASFQLPYETSRKHDFKDANDVLFTSCLILTCSIRHGHHLMTAEACIRIQAMITFCSWLNCKLVILIARGIVQMGVLEVAQVLLTAHIRRRLVSGTVGTGDPAVGTESDETETEFYHYDHGHCRRGKIIVIAIIVGFIIAVVRGRSFDVRLAYVELDIPKLM